MASDLKFASTRVVVREGWTLRERLQAARDQGHGYSAVDDERLSAWQRVVAPHQFVNFEKRLQWCGNTIEHAAWAVNPSAEPPCQPTWLPFLEQLQQACKDSATVSNGDTSIPQGPPQPFEELMWPICTWALQRLRSRLPIIALEGVAPTAFRSFERALLARLSTLSEHALFELFSRYRGVGGTLLANMSGDKPDESCLARDEYLAFVQHNLSDGLSGILGEYPVLGRLLSTVVRSWIEAAQELIERVQQNRAALSDTFGIPEDALLSDVDFNLSDAHRGGRSVATLHFSSASSRRWKVVYKPRNMDVDRAYQAYLDHLNAIAGESVFRVLKILSLGNYGFMEFVEYRPCHDDQELRSLYLNAGRLLAVLYILGCNDCHHENVIAHSGQLVLVDVETLLQGDVEGSIRDEEAEVSDLQQELAQSVLRVGLLPQWRFTAADGRMRAMDSSALGATPPKQATIKHDGWIGINSDLMHWGRVEEAATVPTSYPVAVARPGLLVDFQQQICEGFALQMRLFLQHKKDLLAPGAPLECFAGLVRRVVVRPTYIYALIQLQALQAEALQTAVARGFKLEQLSRAYLISEEKPSEWPLFESELCQMENLDIPYFEQRIDSDALQLPGSMESIPGFSQASGLAASRRRLERLEQSDIDFQLQLIRGAIQASHLKPTLPALDSQELASNSPEAALRKYEPQLSHDRQLTEAFRLGTQLQQHILRGRRGRPEWLGLDLAEDQERFQFGIVGPSLYSGRSGIALYFAALAQRLETQLGFETQAAQLREDAREAIATVVEKLQSDKPFVLSRWLRDQLLGLSGVGGLILTLLTLDRLDLRPRFGNYTAMANQLANRLTGERIQADKCLDVMGGCAGLIGPLLGLAEIEKAAGRSGSFLLALAVSCGDHLVAHQSEDGAWPNMNAMKSLTGFSHGAGGIAAALARLNQATQMNRFLTAATRGLAYERSQFSSAQCNWPDFRATEDATEFSNSWCHGAPGIALSRLCMKSTGLWDSTTEQELQIALTTTARDKVAVDHLCCGELGKAAILNIATHCGLGAQWAAAAQEIVAESMDNAERNRGQYRLSSLVEGHVFLPGLFTGISGIGLVLTSMKNWRVPATCLSCGLLEIRQLDLFL